MNSEESPEKEFVIPTRYKIPIGSYLSWPVGATELTRAFLHVPQIKELQVKFWESYPKSPKGKWPVNFTVIDALYSHPRTAAFNDSDWEFCIHPVPRNMRAEIRGALTQHGFKLIAEWLIVHAKFSGRESHLRFSVIWNSELKELTFGSRDYVLPEVSTEKQKSKK